MQGRTAVLSPRPNKLSPTMMKKETTTTTATTVDGGAYCHGCGGRRMGMVVWMAFVVLCIWTVVLTIMDVKMMKSSSLRKGGDCSDIAPKATATTTYHKIITLTNGIPSCTAYRQRTDWQRLYCGPSSRSDDSSSTAVVLFEGPLASHRASSPSPFEACFLTSIFGLNANMVDNLWNATPYKREFPNHGFFMYTNLVDLQVDGWYKVLYFDPKYKRMITQSRYPKWMAWEHQVIQKLCPVIYYVDGVVTPKWTTLGRLRQATRETLWSRDGISMRLHRRNVTTELVEIIRKKKDIPTNVEETKHWLQQQPDYDQSCKLYQNGFFAYNPKNARFQQAARFLWERYSQELDSWRDQPLWCYTMSKFKMKPILLEKRFFRIESSRYGGRLGTHVYNSDTNTEGQAYYQKMNGCCHKDDDVDEDVDGHDSSTRGGRAGSGGNRSSKNLKEPYAWDVDESYCT